MPHQPFVPTAVPAESRPGTALMLSGGGSRAAYQVGVLEAIADIRKEVGALLQANPFPIITGTSAGAINAASLACGADDFDAAVRRIAQVWRNFHAHQVYLADSVSMLRAGTSWLTLLSLGWVIAKWRRTQPRSLLNNAPLANLLNHLVPLRRLPELIRSGQVQALAVTASSYSSGEHITFFEGDKRLMPWVRSDRRAVRDRISHTHLLASSAIPFVFPATPLQIDGVTQYFGDGSMRQSAPIAPAIHLGGRRILVVGAGRMNERKSESSVPINSSYPSLAQIAGHTLSNIFLDALAVDVERIRRINQTLSLVPDELRNASNLRQVDLLLISPSQRLDGIAERHVQTLPEAVRNMLGARSNAKTTDVKGAALASYLLFEQGFTQELMALGYADTTRQRAEICKFFDWTDPNPAPVKALSFTQPGIERRRDPLRLR
jgi:NTE family protein